MCVRVCIVDVLMGEYSVQGRKKIFWVGGQNGGEAPTGGACAAQGVGPGGGCAPSRAPPEAKFFKSMFSEIKINFINKRR